MGIYSGDAPPERNRREPPPWLRSEHERLLLGIRNFGPPPEPFIVPRRVRPKTLWWDATFWVLLFVASVFMAYAAWRVL